ncbi:MAG: hypothetical protein H7X91_09570 [Burkholderiales bacterium]|nr:hypothetical protein [Burkholderiales bacterium]
MQQDSDLIEPHGLKTFSELVYNRRPQALRQGLQSQQPSRWSTRLVGAPSSQYETLPCPPIRCDRSCSDSGRANLLSVTGRMRCLRTLLQRYWMAITDERPDGALNQNGGHLHKRLIKPITNNIGTIKKIATQDSMNPFFENGLNNNVKNSSIDSLL